MKKIVILLLFMFTFSASAKIYTTPSGYKVDVPEQKASWIEKIFILPSGMIWKEIVPVALAEVIGVWDFYSSLKRACSCESAGSPDSEPRQFNDDGSILWGYENGKKVKRDVGACQINTKAHKEELKGLGLDVINSFEDNVAYAKVLFNREGLAPWSPSKSCWKM